MTPYQQELVKECFLAILVAFITVAVNRYYREKTGNR